MGRAIQETAFGKMPVKWLVFIIGWVLTSHAYAVDQKREATDDRDGKCEAVEESRAGKRFDDTMVRFSPRHKALTITNIQTLRFGDIIAAGNGTVTVSPAGLRSASGGAIAAGGVSSPAVFNIRTLADCDLYAYSLLLPAAITLSSGSGTMIVDTFISALSVPTLVNASGNGQFGVGATLHVSSSQAAGNYSGQFLIEIVFQ